MHKMDNIGIVEFGFITSYLVCKELNPIHGLIILTTLKDLELTLGIV